MCNDHYYSSRPAAGHVEKEIKDSLRGVELSFITDAGVFSRSSIDTGTRLLVENVCLNGANSILDLGCGYGVIGITFAKINTGSKVFMVDVNERAVALSKHNARLNKVSNTTVLLGNGYNPVKEEKFDLIITNPPIRAGKEIIYSFIENSVEFLNKDGRFCAVIQRKQGAKSFEKKMKEVFSKVSIVARGGGFKVFQGTS